MAAAAASTMVTMSNVAGRKTLCPSRPTFLPLAPGSVEGGWLSCVYVVFRKILLHQAQLPVPVQTHGGSVDCTIMPCCESPSLVTCPTVEYLPCSLWFTYLVLR